VEESTVLEGGEEGAVIGFKLEAVGERCARREARFCLTTGASGRGEEGEEGEGLGTD
jgi:hypothetical protein